MKEPTKQQALFNKIMELQEPEGDLIQCLNELLKQFDQINPTAWSEAERVAMNGLRASIKPPESASVKELSEEVFKEIDGFLTDNTDILDNILTHISEKAQQFPVSVVDQSTSSEQRLIAKETLQGQEGKTEEAFRKEIEEATRKNTIKYSRADVVVRKEKAKKMAERQAISDTIDRVGDTGQKGELEDEFAYACRYQDSYGGNPTGLERLSSTALITPITAKLGGFGYIPHNGPWKFSELVDSMDFQDYINTNANIHVLDNQKNADANAYWVDQREVGFIHEPDINKGIKLGTDNVQQCVVVMVNGTDKDGKVAALAHVDRFTEPESLKRVLRSFSSIQDIGISLYGGRDRGAAQQSISDSNIHMVLETIKQESHENKIKINKVGDPNTSSEVIFNPKGITNEDTVIEGQYANKGYQTKDIRLMKRRLADKVKGNSWEEKDKDKIERNSSLEIVNLKDTETVEEFNKNHFDKELAQLCIADYCDGAYDDMLKKLDKAQSDSEREAICSQEFKPFMEGVYYSLQQLGNKTITPQDIYNGKAREQIKRDKELQEKLGDSFRDLKKGKEQKEKVNEEKRPANLSTTNPPSKLYGNLKKQQSDVLFGNPFEDSNHLKRSERTAIETYDIKASFAALNSNSLELLDKLRVESVVTADIDLKAVDVKERVSPDKVGKVEFLAESSHIRDHPENTKSLIERIESGDIGKDTVIAIERKSYGRNLGVPDVIMLASILEHNEKNPEKQLQIPEEITKDSLIYQDAVLYNTAKKHGVKVVGLEGRNLKAVKELPEEYNAAREDYMASRITQLTSKGYNVIAYIGSAHVKNLKKMAENKPDLETGLKDQPNKLTEELQMMAASIGQQARGYVSQSTTTTPSIPVLPNEKQTIKPNSVIGGRE